MLKDRLLTCRTCGVRFLWAVSEQKQSNAEGLAEPPGECRGCAALGELTGLHLGTIKWYDPRKGFGFIRQADGAEVFVHRAALRGARGKRIRPGQPVRYRVVCAQQGPRAVDVAFEEPGPSAHP